MSDHRTDIARKVVLWVLVVDAVLFLGFFVLFGRLDDSRGTPLDPLLWGLAVAAPFGIAAMRVKSGEGIERTLFAQILAWTAGFIVPFTAAFFLYLGRPSSETWFLFAFCGVQLLIPASIRWARHGSQFIGAYGGMVAVLAAVFAYAYIRM